MVCMGKLIGTAIAAFGIGVLIGGLLPCLAAKWLCGFGLIAAGVIIIHL